MSEKNSRHGDPHDYPDIPGDNGLSDEYRDAVMPANVKAAIAKRKAARDGEAEKKVA